VLASVAGPKSVLNLARFARLMAEDSALLDQLANEEYQRLKGAHDGLDAAEVRALAPALRRRVLARLIEETGGPIDSELIQRAVKAVNRKGRATLPMGWTLSSASGVVRCVPPKKRCSPSPPVKLCEGWIQDERAQLAIGLFRSLPSPDCLWIEVVDVRLPLWVRRRRAGDRVCIQPGRSPRKLQDLLVDLGVRAEQRDEIPLVCDDHGTVLWVVGIWPKSGKEVFGHKDDPRNSSRWYLVARPCSQGGGDFLPDSL
jgi:tRNA(Ile)-lysidine synthetase-like protein